MEPKSVALLVHTCDRYQFLYEGFKHFFSKYWSNDIQCNNYFATEEIHVKIEGFTNIQSGRGQWADRLSYLLKNEIKEDYVLYFQEDMWLTKKVNPLFFNQLFELAISNNWKQVKLHSSEVYHTDKTDIFIEGFNIATINNEASDFLMSHQVTLWEKQFLIDQLLKNEHPWRNERRGTKRLRKLNPVIFQADYFAENGKEEINQNNHPVKRSEYHTVSVNGMLDDTVKPFIAELINDGNQEYAASLQHHYDNQLTHDGNPKPRKEDFFKKLKKQLLNH